LVIKGTTTDNTASALNVTDSGDTSRLYVRNDGNVGIGTTGPLVSLDVRTSGNNAIPALSTVPNSFVTMLLGNTGTNGVMALGQDNAGHAWIQGRSRLGDGSSQPLLLNPLGGNVGIGTTAPGGKLDVQVASGGGPGIRLMNTSVNQGWMWYPITNGSNTDMRLYEYNTGGNSDRVTFQAGGNVGIGTTAPGARLNVIGADSLSTSFAANISGATGTGLVVANDGNVGIGTTNPLQKLHVNGHCVTSDTLLPIRRRKKRKNSAEVDGEEDEENGERGLAGKVNDNIGSGTIEPEWEYLMVPIIDIKSGDEVLSLNKNKGKVEYHKINGLMDMGVKDVYELRTKSGRVIRTTANHPYLIKMREKNERENTKKESILEPKTITQKLTNVIQNVSNHITDSNDLVKNSEEREIFIGQSRDMSNIK
jgi:hypothetical protein